MGDYQDRLQPTLYCDLSHVEFTTPEETDDHNNRSEINLNFSWKVDFSEWMIPHAVQQYSTYPQVVRRSNESTTNFSFGVSRTQFRCLSELRGVMEFELRAFLDFYFDVLVDNQQIVFGPGEIYEEEYNCMVPAEDSSIMSSLKRVAVDFKQNISCSICLEDLSSGGDNDFEEALSMPCSHVYHGDCIKKWLRISHYCPLCRFEVPTTN
ncbi:hypothetical protein ACP275_04G135600 [Erythranthe tilingii]